MGRSRAWGKDAVWDGGIFSEWRMEHGHMVRRQTQPNQDRILAENLELQKIDLVATGDNFQPAARIPEVDMIRIKKENPELDSPDPEIRWKAWMHFFRQRENQKYMVRSMRSLKRGL